MNAICLQIPKKLVEKGVNRQNDNRLITKRFVNEASKQYLFDLYKAH